MGRAGQIKEDSHQRSPNPFFLRTESQRVRVVRIGLIGDKAVMNEILRICSFPVEHEDLLVGLDLFHRCAFDLLEIRIVVNTFPTVLMIEQIHHRNQSQSHFTLHVDDVVLPRRNHTHGPSVLHSDAIDVVQTALLPVRIVREAFRELGHGQLTLKKTNARAERKLAGKAHAP